MVLMSDYAVSKHASTRQSIQGLRCCRMTTVRGRCPQYNCWWTQLCVAPSQTQMHHEFMDFLRIPKTVMSMVLRGRCRSPARACGATPTDRSPVPLQLFRISSVPAICLHMGNQRQVQICKLPYKVFQGHRDKETLVVAMHVAQAEQVVKQAVQPYLRFQALGVHVSGFSYASLLPFHCRLQHCATCVTCLPRRTDKVLRGCCPFGCSPALVPPIWSGALCNMSQNVS